MELVHTCLGTSSLKCPGATDGQYLYDVGKPNSSEYLVNSRSYLSFLISPSSLFSQLHLFISVLSTTFFYFQIIFLAHHKYIYYTDTSPGSKLTEFIHSIHLLHTNCVPGTSSNAGDTAMKKKKANISAFIELNIDCKI